MTATGGADGEQEWDGQRGEEEAESRDWLIAIVDVAVWLGLLTAGLASAAMASVTEFHVGGFRLSSNIFMHN